MGLVAKVVMRGAVRNMVGIGATRSQANREYPIKPRGQLVGEEVPTDLIDIGLSS
jgi:hypothetical protein